MSQEIKSIDPAKVEKVIVKRGDRKGYVQFLTKIKEKVEAGYEMLLEPPYRPREYPRTAFFLAKSSTPPKEEKKVEETEAPVDPISGLVEDLKSKEDLLKFAEDNKIDIPEDIKHPLAIKKYIKSSL